MAIKVKHEGNVTSRVYASAAGGKGKRQAEDARVLASMQRGGMGGGGGTGGGARAGGSAPTLSAPTSHATLGSVGSLITPTKSFGQEKELQKQRDDAAMARQKAEQEWKASENFEDRLSRRVLQKGQHEFLTGQQKAEHEWRAAEAEKERGWRENQQRDKERREMRRDTLRREGYSEESILKIEENTRKKESIESDGSLTPEQKAAALEDIRKEREGIVPSYEAMPDPNDPAQSIREVTLSDGRKVQMMRDARGNWTEYVPDRSKMPAQEIFDSGIDYNGVRYIPDGRGGLTPLVNPNEKNSAAIQEKRNVAILKRAQEIVTNSKDTPEGQISFADALKQATAESNQAYGVPTPTSTSTNGGAAPTSTSKSIGTDKEGKPIHSLPSDEEEKKNKWGSFAR
jgi:hypothetical protein